MWLKYFPYYIIEFIKFNKKMKISLCILIIALFLNNILLCSSKSAKENKISTTTDSNSIKEKSDNSKANIQTNEPGKIVNII